MKLEDQVVSLELAKKLKELGVNNEHHFVWESPNTEWGWTDWYLVPASQQHDTENFPAYTVAELGEMLPFDYEEWRTGKNFKNKWFVLNTQVDFEANTEADARAKMLIYLIENNLIMV